MTIDTIKNVLSRIMTINQNLTDESLHTLLIASGWDEQDIKEGLNIFRTVRGGVDISKYEPIINEEEIKRVNKNNEGIEKERVTEEGNMAKDKETKELDAKIPKTTAADFIFPYHGSENKEHGVLQSLRDKILDASEKVTKDIETKSNQDIDTKNDDKVVDDLFFAPHATKQIEKQDKTEDKSNEIIEPSKDTDEINSKSESDNVHSYSDYRERPVGLIALDLALFLTVLSLIVYILLK